MNTATAEQLPERNTVIRLYRGGGGFFRVRDYMDDFRKSIDRKESTWKGYKTCLIQFDKWLDKNRIRQPDEDDIRQYRGYLATSDFKPATQGQYLRAVKQFFEWAARKKIYEPLELDEIHNLKIRHDIHRKDGLGKDDVKKIAATIDRTTERGKRDFAIFMLESSCALRCIEINRANVEDVKTIDGRKYLYIQRKGHDEKDAAIWIIPEVDAALTDYLDSRSDDITPKSPLFVSTSRNDSKGQRISTTTVSTSMKSILVNAGFNSDRLTAHSLRHTAATAAARTGNIEEASEFLGHTNIETTKIYVDELKREEQTTARKVYDYLYGDDETAEARAEIKVLADVIEPGKLQDVINYMKSITRKGATK